MKEVMTRQRTLKWSYIGVIVLIFCGIGLYIYQSYLTNNTSEAGQVPIGKSTPTPTAPGPEVLDIHSSIVQDLYKMVRIGNDGMMLRYFIEFTNDTSNYQFKVKTMLAENITPEMKLYMAYRMVSASEIKTTNCSNHLNIVAYGKQKQYVCGEVEDAVPTNDTYWYNDTNSSTKEINENDLKVRMENIFGPDTYQRVVRFGIDAARAYEIDEITNSYIYCSLAGGGTGLGLNSSLESATKIDNKIEVMEKLTATQAPYQTEIVKHTFTLHNNGNYYYMKSEPVNV